ncbi:hypothetical protein HZS_7991 [Henneguya salminicola]|nr:hypothetical protein HZS_7991 [Henneguya salminicola]
MPKNKGKGGKNRRRGKNETDKDRRELICKEEGQEYGQVTKILGQGYVETLCFDGVKRVCHIRGKMRKKVWVNHGDIVLVGIREFQPDRADIIAKYTSDEAKTLKAYNELPESVKLLDSMGVTQNIEDHDITFDLRPDENEVAPQLEDRYFMPSSDSGEEDESD